MKTTATLLLTALLLGCTREPLPFWPANPQVMVHGVLEAGVDTAYIQLTEIGARSPGSLLDTHPVSGALVELSGGGSTLRLLEAPEGFTRCFPSASGSGPIWVPDPETAGRGCYAALVPGGVRPGEPYELRIALPGGRVVLGTARIPSTLELIQPLAEPRMSAVPSLRGLLETEQPVVLRWRVAPGTPGISVTAWSEAVFHAGSALPGDVCHATLEQWPHAPWLRPVIDPQQSDSIAQRVIVTGCNWQHVSPEQQLDSLHVRLRVAALDSAFLGYLALLEVGESVRLRDAAIGLDGAVGVFAGIAPFEQRVVLVRERQF